jgi:hypothetical protein
MPGRIHSGSRFHLQFCRFAVGAFALGLMLLVATRAPAGPLAGQYQHTVHYQGQRANQPCFDSATFDWTVPRAAFPPVLVPDVTRQTLHPIPIAFSPGPSEFRLYNRPPPLS